MIGRGCIDRNDYNAAVVVIMTAVRLCEGRRRHARAGDEWQAV